MKRLIFIALAATLSAAACAQSWKNYYEAGLDAAKAEKWSDARTDFLQAAQSKQGDIENGISLPGSIFERRVWRGGAPYSPNFMAAYCALKESQEMTGDARTGMLHQSAAEFETLLNRRQFSNETFFFLDEAYVLLGDNDKRATLGVQYNGLEKINWRVDTEGIASDDEALVSQLPKPAKETEEEELKKEGKKQQTKRDQRQTKKQPKASLPALPAVSTTTVVSAPATEITNQQKKHRKDRENEAPKTAPAATDTATSTSAITPDAKTSADIHTTLGPTTATATPTLPSVPSTPKIQPAAKSKGNKKDKKEKNDATPAKPADVVAPVSPKAAEKAALAAPAGTIMGSVAPMGDKYAIIIGNSESKIEGGALPFAGDDAQLMRQTLITNAGYLDSNIEVVVNGTAAQIAATVNALASRIPDKGTVFIYFTGVGTNVDGKDYLAGVDSDLSSDTSTMICKDDIYKAFMLKGARIFAFFQANRPVVDGHYFGSECPLVGSISQMEATLPGENVYAINADGKQVGLFTNGLVSVMKEMRSNRVPILDFGWSVFYKLRTGDTGNAGGSSNQSPSLPVLTNMASDARF